MIFGHISDLLPSRRAPFLGSLCLVFLSTLCFAMAQKLWVLLAARLLQGFATAMVTVFGYALLNEVVGPENLGTAMGYTTMGLSFGLMIGPVIGGVLYDYFGYFLVFVPILCLLSLETVLRAMIVVEPKPLRHPEPSRKSSQGEQVVNTQESHQTPGDVPTESDTLLKIPKESGASKTSAYLVLLSSGPFVVTLVGLLVLNSVACGFDSILTPYLHDTFGIHAGSAGALFLTLAIPMLLTPIFGKLTDSYGPKLLTTIGLLLLIPPIILSSFVSRETMRGIPKLAVLLSFIGLAFAIALPPIRVEATLVVKELEQQQPQRFGPNGAYGRAFGLVNLMVATGGMVGPLYGGFVRITASWKILLWTYVAFSAGLLGLVLLFTKTRKRERAGTSVGQEV